MTDSMYYVSMISSKPLHMYFNTKSSSKITCKNLWIGYLFCLQIHNISYSLEPALMVKKGCQKN